MVPSVPPRTDMVCERVPHAGGSFSTTRPTNVVFASYTVNACGVGKRLLTLSQ